MFNTLCIGDIVKELSNPEYRDYELAVAAEMNKKTGYFIIAQPCKIQIFDSNTQIHAHILCVNGTPNFGMQKVGRCTPITSAITIPQMLEKLQPLVKNGYISFKIRGHPAVTYSKKTIYAVPYSINIEKGNDTIYILCAII